MPSFTLSEDDALATPPAPGLHLIGLGPGRLDLAPLAAITIARACTHRWLETYTSSLPDGEIERLERSVGPLSMAARGDVEAPEALLAAAREAPTALLVVGDPLQATTHTDLMQRCAEAGIPCHLIHATSVTTLVTGTLGLQSYRFGRQITLPWPRGAYLPTSPLELHCEVHASGLHTLALLDLDPMGAGGGTPRHMTPAEALDVLERMRTRLLDDPPPHLSEPEDDLQRWRAVAVAARLGTPPASWPAILAADLASSHERRVHGTLAELGALPAGRIHSLVLLGEMSEAEAEAVQLRCTPAVAHPPVTPTT